MNTSVSPGSIEHPKSAGISSCLFVLVLLLLVGGAIARLRQSLASYPGTFFVDIQLGNICVKRGSRARASRAYSDALQYAPNDSQLRGLIAAQITRVSTEPLNQIPDLRDPFME